jgi:2-oxoglutarate dehydrogenase complex dehydrogenase (E1) component-like enzyme
MALNLAPVLQRHAPGVPLTSVTRAESAAPSVGSLSVHSEQQRALLAQALRT